MIQVFPNVNIFMPNKTHVHISAVDAWLGSKHVSGKGFTVEKVYRSHYLSDIVEVDFTNLSLRSYFFS